uniref:Uncharacterized protein n=1 Tax=Arundo donax TaxID=35708 RepID=A0A0A9F7I0_ARUDO
MSSRRPRSCRPPGSPETRGWGGWCTGTSWQVVSAVTRSWLARWLTCTPRLGML